MPSSLSTSLFAVGLILAVLGLVIPAVVAAGLGLGWELAVTFTAGA